MAIRLEKICLFPALWMKRKEGEWCAFSFVSRFWGITNEMYASSIEPEPCAYLLGVFAKESAETSGISEIRREERKASWLRNRRERKANFR
jgi:hypothetical protein